MIFESGYKKLKVFSKSEELAVEIYKITKNFPKDELFGLVSQLRRAIVSVPANIAEGYGRRTLKDKLQFYFIARGSLNEVEFYIDLSLKLNYIAEKEHERLNLLREEIGKLLSGLIKSLSN